jgi:hypothetical protein
MAAFYQAVRIFICRTLRNPHAERDHLVTVVSPELRKRVEQLGRGSSSPWTCASVRAPPSQGFILRQGFGGQVGGRGRATPDAGAGPPRAPTARPPIPGKRLFSFHKMSGGLISVY